MAEEQTPEDEAAGEHRNVYNTDNISVAGDPNKTLTDYLDETFVKADALPESPDLSSYVTEAVVASAISTAIAEIPAPDTLSESEVDARISTAIASIPPPTVTPRASFSVAHFSAAMVAGELLVGTSGGEVTATDGHLKLRSVTGTGSAWAQDRQRGPLNLFARKPRFWAEVAPNFANTMRTSMVFGIGTNGTSQNQNDESFFLGFRPLNLNGTARIWGQAGSGSARAFVELDLTGLTFDNNTRHIFFADVSPTGTARFYIDGILRGTLTSSVIPTGAIPAGAGRWTSGVWGGGAGDSELHIYGVGIDYDAVG